MQLPGRGKRFRYTIAIFSFILFIVPELSFGQALLPNITVINKNGKNVVSWSSPYNSIRQIGVQRSQDSLFNYATIGFVHRPDTKINSYTDDRPYGGVNFYRLFIQLSNGSYFYSNPAKSVAGAPALSTGGAGSAAGGFIPSLFVYTNPEGNVNISLSDAARNHYHVRFYDASGKKLFEIDRIQQPLLIIDKSNFLHSGWFSFELFENGKLKEQYRFFIPNQWGGG